MAKSAVVSIPKDTVVQLTDDDATTLTWQIRKGVVAVTATVGANAPSTDDDAVVYGAMQGEAGISITSFNPGIAGTRLYGRAMGQDAEVFIAHD